MFLYVFFFTKAFSMLANHVLSNMKIRKGEQRRDALLARLNVDTDQLLGEERTNKIWYYIIKVIGLLREAFSLCV